MQRQRAYVGGGPGGALVVFCLAEDCVSGSDEPMSLWYPYQVPVLAQRQGSGYVYTIHPSCHGMFAQILIILEQRGCTAEWFKQLPGRGTVRI